MTAAIAESTQDATATTADLPPGFRIRVRADADWYELLEPGERLIVGGSPLRAVRLTAAATDLLGDGTLTVCDRASAGLARRLLDGNLADPALGPPVDAGDLTVVIPVRDRPDQLDQCLTAVAGLEVIVVDDASLDRPAVHDVVRRHGARLVSLPENVGPAGGRNAGLAEVSTPYVAFVDSDIAVDPATLLGLAGHFADPRVALVGPLVEGVVRSERPRWFERYDAAASSLALGRRSCSVAPGAAVGWLPGACLVALTDALRGPEGVDGFAADLRVGEDVDLVWRLVAAGWRVRYEPAFQASHDVRPTLRAWLGRKVVYGTGGAPLAQRHGDAVAVARLSPLMAAAGAGVLLRRPWSAALAVGATAWAARSVRGTLPAMPTRNTLAACLAAKGLGWSVRQESALILRHWWPAAVAGCLISRTVRRATVSALVVDAIVAAAVDRPLPAPESPDLGFVAGWVGRRLDDVAYGGGLWIGAVRHRAWGALAVTTVRSGRSRTKRVAQPRGTGTAS